MGFWLGEGLISESCLAERRSHELVFVARSVDGLLRGATTASLGRRTHDGRNVYDLRVFVASTHRGRGLARQLALRSCELLLAESRDHPAAGVRLAPETPKLGRPGIGRYLERHGFVHRGRNHKGMDVWFMAFE